MESSQSQITTDQHGAASWPVAEEPVLEKHKTFLERYLAECPAPLALERSFECEILSREDFRRPVLDLGCGEGLFASTLFRERVDLGIDPNPKEIERAAAGSAYDELICCGGDQIPVDTHSFRTVFSNSVLEHIQELSPVLDEVYRVLRPGGRFYVTVPSHQFDQYSIVHQSLKSLRLNSLAERYRGFFNQFWRHYHFYTPEGWSQKFEQAGFHILHSRSYCPRIVCLMNDLMAPFCASSFVCKKLTNRWFVFPRLRKPIARLESIIGNRMLNHDDSSETGGLLFFALQKPESIPCTSGRAA